jgi:hypothetical protein
MKGEPTIGNELLTLLSQWYDETIKKYQRIFSSNGLTA